MITNALQRLIVLETILSTFSVFHFFMYSLFYLKINMALVDSLSFFLIKANLVIN